MKKSKLNRCVKKVILVGLCISLLSSMAGCKLAKKDDGSGESVDKLIGCFITTEYIGDEKIYAKLTQKTQDGIEFMEYEFKDNEGIACYIPTIYAKDSGTSDYVSGTYGEGLSSVSTVINSNEDGTMVNKINGTIYITEENMYHMNNVYQEKDGDVYMVAGVATYVTVRGGGYDDYIEETYTVRNGDELIKEKMKVSISYDYMPSPKSIKYVYMDSDNNIIETNEYKPAEVPGEVNIPEDVEYIIVETYAYDKNEEMDVITRQIADRTCEDVMTYVDTGKGVCEQNMTILSWK